MTDSTMILPPPERSPTPGRLLLLPTWTLWRREMVRFFRQRNRVVGALATPIVFWLLLGSGLNRSFILPTDPGAGRDPQPMSYLEYFFPGTVVMILLFTAIFSTISVIEDRREGFLQGVLVAPIHRLALVLGKVLGGAGIALIQGLLFLALWPLVGHWPGAGSMLLAMLIMGLLALGLTALGLCIAWPMDSTAGFHAIMNLFLMPMWFLSGAVFPLHSAPPWLQWVMLLNPLTYGQAAFTTTLRGEPARPEAMPLGLPWPALVAVTAGFALVIVWLATVIVSRPRRDGTS